MNKGNESHIYSQTNFKVNDPFVQTFCIEKDPYMDAI